MENIAYIAYNTTGEFINIVSRCARLFLLDLWKTLTELISGATAAKVSIAMPLKRFALLRKISEPLVPLIKSKRVVVRMKGRMLIYSARCTSGNCLENLTCGVATDAPRKLGTWVYVVVGIAIFGGMRSFLLSNFLI